MILELRHKLMLINFLAIAVSGVSAYVFRTPLAIDIFNILLIIAGIWMLASVARGAFVSIISYAWPQCSYTVTETKLMMRPGPGGEQRWNKYVPFFRITYKFNGKEFTVTSEDNLNLHVKREFVTPHDANDYLSLVSEKKYGSVLHVNPKEPGMAFLRSGVNRDQVGVFIFALITVILPLLTLVGAIEWR
jgi:hypothetical protein